MTRITPLPRPDQISLLTQGITLPLSRIPNEHIDIVIESIVEAFNYIKVNHPNIISSETEVLITAAICNRLKNTLPDNPILRLIVTNIVRGEENLSYNGSHIEKRPDFSFKLSSQERIFPLLAEAKVIGTTRSQSLDSYCKKGILRFVQGEYSWWDRDAIMIAYAINTQTAQDDLTPLLKTDKTGKTPLYFTKSFPKKVQLNTQIIPRSEHFRKFRYNLGTLGTGKPGTISLWHLWLS